MFICLLDNGCGCDDDGNCWSDDLDPTSGGWMLFIDYYSLDDDDTLTLTKTTRVLFEGDEVDGGTWYDFLEADMTDPSPTWSNGTMLNFDLDWVEKQEPFRLFD